jgi:HPr kinase/phosphorylase
MSKAVNGMLLHASAIALDGGAVLLMGPPGSGKSDLVLRLLHEGWRLVADDQVMVAAADGAVLAAPPPALHGRLEVRGLGILRDLPVVAPVPLRLVVALVARADVPRLPAPDRHAVAGIALPLLRLDPFAAAATAKLAMAYRVLRGEAALLAGAFA